MRFLSFVSYQLRWQLIRRRWFLPLPLLLFLAYRSFNYLTQPGLAGPMQTTNAWDLLFLIFGNRYNIYFALACFTYTWCATCCPSPTWASSCCCDCARAKCGGPAR